MLNHAVLLASHDVILLQILIIEMGVPFLYGVLVKFKNLVLLRSINTFTVEVTFWHFLTLGHLDILDIHYRDLPMVPFYSELNSAHF